MADNVLLEDLEIYQISLDIGEQVWSIVDKWEFFAKKAVGGQFVEARTQLGQTLQKVMGLNFSKTGNSSVTIAVVR